MLFGFLGILGFIVSFAMVVINLVRRKPKKLWFIGMGICFILFVVGVVSDTSTTKTGDTLVPTPKVTALPASPEDGIKAIISKTLGTSNREGVAKIHFMDIQRTNDSYYISISFAIDDNLTESMIKSGAQRDVLDTMKALYQSTYPVQSISMLGTFSMKDKYANLSEQTVLKAMLNTGTARLINWGNMYPADFFKVLDTLEWHPVFLTIQ